MIDIWDTRHGEQQGNICSLRSNPISNRYFVIFFLVLLCKWAKNLHCFSLLALLVNEGLQMWCSVRRQTLCLFLLPECGVGWMPWVNVGWWKCVSTVTATTLEESWHSVGDEPAVTVCHGHCCTQHCPCSPAPSPLVWLKILPRT